MSLKWVYPKVKKNCKEILVLGICTVSINSMYLFIKNVFFLELSAEKSRA